MEHETELITTLALSLALALALGFVATRLRLPAIVGYLLAGVVVGPATPGLMADVSIASQLAEIGVMLLMFGVGLHLSLDDLLAVKRIAIPGAIVQMGVATVLGTWMASSWWGWDLAASVVFGVTLSCASTVVLLRALEERGILDSMNGRIAVGWLVVEDLVTVVALVLLPPLASQPGPVDETLGDQAPTWLLIGATLLQVGLFLAIMLILGRRFLPWLLWQVARTGSRELFTLAVIALAIGIAYAAAELFNVSFALGAFVAGMVLRESEFSHRAGQDTLPLRDAFAVLFFVSVGMLLEPSILIDDPWHVLAVVAIVMVGKSLAATILVLLLRYPINSAMVMGASLAQIGEFSFILAGLGLTLGILPVEAVSLVVAAAFISIALNPLMFRGSHALRAFLLTQFAWARRREFETDRLAVLPTGHDIEEPTGHVILIGYGRVGRRIHERLRAEGVPTVVIEVTRERVEDLRRDGELALAGDGSQESLLRAAHVERATALVVAVPSETAVQRAADAAEALHPGITLVLRTHSEEQWESMRARGLASVYFGEDELASSMVQSVLPEGRA
jgi:CPA2 family monovalent cation:H+ antiporter-2